jgi:hypothetical protein
VLFCATLNPKAWNNMRILMRPIILACMLLLGITGGALSASRAEQKPSDPGADGRAAFAAGDFGKAGPLLVESALGGDVYGALIVLVSALAHS